VGGTQVAVLACHGGQTGWSDGLTRLHEDSAGPDHPIDRLSRDWALSAVRRHVKLAAPVLLEAGPRLYDVHDEYLQHHRRYSASALASLLSDAGLTLLEQSHLGCTVYPAFAMVKHWNRRTAAADPATKRRIVEANIQNTRGSVLVRGLLKCESWLGRYVSFPFGIRCVAIGRKPFDVTA
jgi:hypothetical protein